MDPEKLRAMQAPLKERYRSDPSSALVTLSASGRLAPEYESDLAFDVETWRGRVVAGLHAATGGDGALACSGDMLLQALVACAGVTLGAVATSMGVAIRSGTVSAEGDLDFRGTLGVSKDAPVGFRAIRLRFHLDTDADEAKLAKLVELTERYCVVAQTLRAGCGPAVTWRRSAGTHA
jgi:uncharacterized OsmC-like protein